MRAARLSELPSVPNELVEAEWKPVRHHLGISAFGTNAYVARAPDQVVIEEHAEGPDGHEELYVVVAGAARFTVDGETFDASAGTVVFVTPAETRVARALEAGTTILAVGAAPGTAFTVSEWEAKRLA